MSDQKNIETNNYYKIFVGNVPYECSNEEFRECFRDMNGYITADVKRKRKRN